MDKSYEIRIPYLNVIRQENGKSVRDILERVYSKAQNIDDDNNVEKNFGIKARSMMVGDVVIVDGAQWACHKHGWNQSYDLTQLVSPMILDQVIENNVKFRWRDWTWGWGEAQVKRYWCNDNSVVDKVMLMVLVKQGGKLTSIEREITVLAGDRLSSWGLRNLPFKRGKA
jgi:hypothetical protein